MFFYFQPNFIQKKKKKKKKKEGQNRNDAKQKCYFPPF